MKAQIIIFLKVLGVLIIYNLLILSSVFGQVPESMSYQAVVRDANNNLVTNQTIGMQISIIQDSTMGSPVYVETQIPTTNANGLVTVEIGSGSVISGDFSSIDWSNGPYFIKTEIDLNGGSNYTISGTTQLLSVPYALYAKNSENTGNAWSLTGNEGTVPGTNFIGTTDNADLEIKINNSTKTRITNKGQIEILNTGYSVFVGQYAGAADDLSNNYNVFIGYSSGKTNTSGYHNTAIGTYSLRDNTTGSNNTAIGNSSLEYNTTGYDNTAVGYMTLTYDTTGYCNTAIGTSALFHNTSGYENTAIGWGALADNTTGIRNSANGYQVLTNNTTGSYNTASGWRSLAENTTGNSNTSIGYAALSNNTTESYNTAIGFAAYYNNNYYNSTAIGYETEITANNQIRLGNSDITSIGGFVSWTNVSDKRFKKDIKEDVHGLDFIMKLHPVTYHLDMNAIAKFLNTPDSLRLYKAEQIKEQMVCSGFIAQEVEQAAEDVGYKFSGVDKPKNNNDYYGLRYAEFVVPLVKAVQEQQKIIEKQQKEIDELKKLVNDLINKQ